MNNIDITRFIEGYQEDFDTALQEIRDEYKRSHWMWYIFPQIKGLGKTDKARFYSIKDLDEARAFLNDSYLNEKLRILCNELLKVETENPQKIFGYTDSMKLNSSMTLFSEVAEDNQIFLDVLDKFFKGKKDPNTLSIIEFNGFK